MNSKTFHLDTTMVFNHREYSVNDVQQHLPPKLPPKRKEHNFFKISAEVNDTLADRNDLPYLDAPTSSFV